MGSLFFSALLIIYTMSAQAATNYQRLGQRPADCTNLTGDDWELTTPNSLSQETEALFRSDRLKTLVVPAPHCFRVGTEIKLFLNRLEENYLGRATISGMSRIERQKLVSHPTGYSKEGLRDLLKESSASQFYVVDVLVTEKISDQFVNERFGRLSSCFASFGDWESYRITGPEGERILQDIISGKKKADIWNGTFNCYKVGVRTKIVLVDPDRELESESKEEELPDLGNIIASELHLTHISRLTQAQADHFGLSLSELRKSLEAKKDVDGGFVTMVVFSFEPPQALRPQLSR